MIIRRASLDDCDAICAMHIPSVREIVGKSGLYTPDQIEAWAGPKTARDYVVPIQKYLFFVAVASGEIVGLGELDPEPPPVDVEGDAEVRGLYFAKVACGRGWGAAMMEHLESLARGFGARTVRVDGTLNAKPFYERMGYEERCRRSYRFPSGVEVPSVRMVKTFSA